MLKLRPGTTSLRWTVWRAHAFVARFQVLDDEGAPRDLTGASARLLLTPLGAELAVLEATIGAGIAIVDAEMGVLDVDLTPIQTRALTAGAAAVDLAVTAADGAKLLHVRARIPVRETQDALQGDAIVAGGADGLAELVDEAPELTDEVSATEVILVSDPARAPNRRNKRPLKLLLDARADLAEMTAALADKADADWVASALALKAPLDSPALSGAPTSTTPPTSDNSARIATTAMVKAALAELVASSPAALDTLNELAAALGNDASFAATVTNALAGKVSVGISGHEVLAMWRGTQAQLDARGVVGENELSIVAG